MVSQIESNQVKSVKNVCLTYYHCCDIMLQVVFGISLKLMRGYLTPLLSARMGLSIEIHLNITDNMDMHIQNERIYRKAKAIIERLFGKDAQFREGQYEAIDDIVDSRWTLTVCGYKLMEAGCEKVFPFALADSSHNEG